MKLTRRELLAVGATLTTLLSTRRLYAEGPADERLLVLYDPDANHASIAMVAKAFNSFLHSAGLNLRFQPVQAKDKLDELLASGTVDSAIIASALLKSSGNRFKPLLVLVQSGSPYFRKVPIATKELQSLDGKKVAASNTDIERKDVLLANLRSIGVSARDPYLIPVAKDIDAVLATTFETVDAALVTLTSIELVKRLNPAAAAKVIVLGETKQTLRAPLCHVQGSTLAPDVLQRSFSAMSTIPAGAQLLALLGVDRWVPFETKMMEHV